MAKTRNNLLDEQLVYNGRSKTPTHLHLCAYDRDEVKFFSEKNSVM